MAKRLERHARGKGDWSLPPSRSDEIRQATANDPHPARRAPGRKDTKRWCRGKEGVEHQVTVVLHSRHGHKCGWREIGHWVHTGPVPPRGVTLPKWPRRSRKWVVVDRRWSCVHEYQCQVCGKYLGPAPECPSRPAAED